MGKASRGLDFALQAGQGIVGAGMGLLLQGGQDRRQIEQQKKLQSLEISGQKEMTDYNMMKQLEMWKATNYGAQMEQLKAAGLNPGLIYGMGGAGGATTGQAAGNVTGGHAPVGGGEAITMMQNATQMGLMRAQKDLIDAQTEKTKAEIPQIGAGTKKLGAETTGIELNNEFLRKTIEDRIDIINTDANRQIQELDIAIGNKEVERRTREARVKTILLEAIEKQLTNGLIDQQTKLTKAGTARTEQETNLIKEKIITETDHLRKYWANQILMGWGKLDHQQNQEALEALNMDKDVLDKILESLPQVIIGRFGPKGTGPKPVTGFHKR